MAASLQYTLNDYNTILFGTSKNDQAEETPMSYTLPQNVLNIIKVLSSKFGVEEKPKKVKQAKPIDESWIQPQIVFKPTVIMEKQNEGPEKTMHDIRSALNKISNKNYEVNRDMIIELLQTIVLSDKEEKEEDLKKIGNNIFDIASTNKFFSEIYARLYKDISEKFPEVFNKILVTFLEGFTNTMKTIEYVDQKENYDKFCSYNKENDRRKATSMFITNLVKNHVIKPEILSNIIGNIQEILRTYMNEANRTNEVEEIVENMYILFTNDQIYLKSCAKSPLIEVVREFSKMKPKEMPSVSSRAIFKCLDILDKI